MRIGLYKDEYGIAANYREFPCCEIDIDSMTSGTDYILYANGDEVTIRGVPVAVKHFSITTAGCEKIVSPIEDESGLIMSKPFWTWNDDTEVRDWMGGHFTAQEFESQPDDWDTALYWKYYTYTHDTSYNAFDQWKNPTSTTYNQSTTYYTCDAEQYEPQKVYYGKGKYAPCFTIGQCLHNPPNGASISGVGGTIGGATYNGYMCGSNLSSGGSGTARTRIFALKGADEEYTGYAGMHDYTSVYAICLHTFPSGEILTSDPPQNREYKHHWQLAHIVYNNREWIGWGEIKYNHDHPDQMQSADFTCVYREIFEDAIVPDAPPYSNGSATGNAGGAGGTGPGLPDGDVIEPTRVTGGLAPIGYGLHAYQVTASDIGVLNNFLWGRSGNAFDPGGMWNRFLNYKFNPVAGIVSLHHIPYDLLCTPGSSVNVMMAGITLDGVSTGGVTVSGLGITDTDHIGHLRIPDSGYFEIEEPYIGFQDFARTKVHLYLPFCGVVELDPAKCIGGGLVVDYQCDNLNGNVCAQVKVITPQNQRGTRRQFVAAVASGNAAYHIPVTGNDNGTGEILGSLKQAAVGMITGSVGSIAGAALDLGLDTAKHTTSVSGSLAGNVGYLGSLDVILEITYGDYYNTDGEYPATVGRPSYVQGAVKEFSGFCQFKAHTESIDGATDSEKQEIARLLEQGIIVNITE